MHLLLDPNTAPAPQISFDEFLRIDIRAGTVISATPFPEARKPALKLEIDFGPGVGVKRSSAQITQRYDPAGLVGRQVLAVVNFPPRQIGKFMSEVLILRFASPEGVILAVPDHAAQNGARLV